jgi:rubrerythrin
MFMTEVLGRCSLLERRVADIYSQFAASLNDDKELASFWLGMAEEEKHHAKILAAEKAALEVDSDTGYFMPEFPAKLAEMDTLLKLIEEKARTGVTKDEAFELALQLEQSELNTIYRDLVLMGRAAVKLMARHISKGCWKGSSVSYRRGQYANGLRLGSRSIIWRRGPSAEGGHRLKKQRARERAR